ncbi:MAG: hypothetical protein FWH29_08330 [Methanobrevibacter sp.]|nr:hypothetical protein [Methanobrevibacter sp.]
MSSGTNNIKPDLLKAVSKIAKKEGISENQALNDIIEKGIEKSEQKIPDYLIANKNRKPNSERKKRMAGIVKGCKPFNAVELVREVRRGI